MIKFFGIAISIAILCACEQRVDEELISYFGAPERNIIEAGRAADICLRNSFQRRENVFRQSGYKNAVFEDPERDVKELGAILLIQPETDVVVQLGEGGGLSGCIVGLKGMSPQQSYELALPWVQHFEATSNTELGQGLSPNAIQAWRSFDLGRGYPVFIAAYKTWDVLEVPGAAIRLSQ